MPKLHIVIALALLLAGSCRAEDRPTYESLWAEATQNPKHTVKQYPDITLVIDEPALWYFTKPTHPAHPGVIKREVTQANGAIYVGEKGWSFAPDSGQPAFQKWMDQIKELDRQVKADFERRKGK